MTANGFAAMEFIVGFQSAHLCIGSSNPLALSGKEVQNDKRLRIQAKLVRCFGLDSRAKMPIVRARLRGCKDFRAKNWHSPLR